MAGSGSCTVEACLKLQVSVTSVGKRSGDFCAKYCIYNVCIIIRYMVYGSGQPYKWVID